MTILLRQEAPQDICAIEALTIAAFRDAFHTRHTEQFIIRALRTAHELTLSLVAEEHGRLVGHVAISPVTIFAGGDMGSLPSSTMIADSRVGGWYGLGPASILPERQRQGIGSRLIEETLFRLRAMGAAGCVVLGEPAYYSRFGFKNEPQLRLPEVPPEYFMAQAFHDSAPTGIVRYSNAFNATA